MPSVISHWGDANPTHGEAPLHTPADGWHCRVGYPQMLVGGGGNRDPPTRLVEMFSNAATLEDSLAFPQKIKHRGVT